MSVCWCVQLMLIIDSREKYSNTGKDRADGLAAKIQVIQDRGISVDVRMLEQGDVLWIAHSRYHSIFSHFGIMTTWQRLQHNLRTLQAVLWSASSNIHIKMLIVQHPVSASDKHFEQKTPFGLRCVAWHLA